MLEGPAEIRAQGGLRQNGGAEASSRRQDEGAGEQVPDDRKAPSEVHRAAARREDGSRAEMRHPGATDRRNGAEGSAGSEGDRREARRRVAAREGKHSGGREDPARAVAGDENVQDQGNLFMIIVGTYNSGAFDSEIINSILGNSAFGREERVKEIR